MNARYRIDDRLIHGQVVVGCCRPFSIQRLILARDEVAADDFQSDIYRAAVPPHIQAVIASVEEAAARLAAPGDDPSTLVVVEGAVDLWRLREAGAVISSATLGGAHRSSTREQELVPGVFLSDADREALRRLIEAGVELTVQSVPGASSLGLSLERLK